MMGVFVIEHSGTPHQGSTPHSGRYKWGSGKYAFQRPQDFLDRVNHERNRIRLDPNNPEGLSEKKRLADAMGMSIRELNSEVTLAIAASRQARQAHVLLLSDQGLSASDISRQTGIPETTVRNLLNKNYAKKQALTASTADVIKAELKKTGLVDIGDGVAESMGITRTRLDAAVASLKNEGYVVDTIRVKQATGKGKTTVKVLAQPGMSKEDIWANRDKIGVIGARFESLNSLSTIGLGPVKSISSKRVQIMYGDQGGSDKDGVIELRRGVKGLDLGDSKYAQVRIGVDGKYYLKGMALYSDDLPDGVDIRFNSNKKTGTPKEKVFKSMEVGPDGKPLTSDPLSAFGSLIRRQSGYLNIVREEGEWATWSKTLSSQFLSKQPIALAKQQLKLSELAKKDELEEIRSLTNPVLRKTLLEDYAGSCDTAARLLKAAALPGQTNKVILPVPEMSPKQVYAPGYKTGTEVVLIRHPHGGTFEIPSLVVNNNNKQARKLLGNAKDAVGIHPKVAAQLSGADFDGDTVLVIPNPKNGLRIRSDKAIKDLQEFDPKTEYAGYKGMKRMTEKQKGMEMGVASNLINDMTIRNAPLKDITRAVKYSMVVIDAAKHGLDWKRAAKELDIEQLKRDYQPRPDKEAQGKAKPYGGASTLLSRAKSAVYVNERREEYRPDPVTGEKRYRETGALNKKTGAPKVTKTTQMDEAKDALHLSSGTRIENVYGRYANTMKKLGNQARKEAAYETPLGRTNKEAAAKYKAEVASLEAKRAAAVANLPRERKAQLYANYLIKMKTQDNPDMDDDEKDKIRKQSIKEARTQLGVSRPPVDITDREWEAIQAGAISPSKQRQIFRFTDSDALKERAMPRTKNTLTPAKKQRAKALLDTGRYTYAEVAEQLGVSASTLEREF